MADIFGYNTRKTPYGTVRTPAVDYSALGQYGLDFIKNTVNLPTTLWNANKYVGNKMLNGINALDKAMYTYDPKTAGKQVKQFVTGQQQSNTNQIIPNQPSKNVVTNPVVQQTVNSGTKKETKLSSSTQGKVKKPNMQKLYEDKTVPVVENENIASGMTPANINDVNQYMTNGGDVANSLIYPESAGVIANQIRNNNGLTFANTGNIANITPDEQAMFNNAENKYIANQNFAQGLGGNEYSALANVGFSNGMNNNMYSPTGENSNYNNLSNADSYSKFLSSFTTANKPYGSYGEAWNVGNKEGGFLGGISNMWNQFTTEGGTQANPTASGAEKALGSLSSLAGLYGAFQNQKYQKDLMNLANRQQAFQEAQANRVNSMQDQAKQQYDLSFK